MTIPTQLSEKLLAALQSVLGENLPQGFVPAVTPSQDLRFGDYQSNAAMVLAKQVRTNPRALATQVVEAFGDSDEFLDGYFDTAYATDRCRCITENGRIAAATMAHLAVLQKKQ